VLSVSNGAREEAEGTRVTVMEEQRIESATNGNCGKGDVIPRKNSNEQTKFFFSGLTHSTGPTGSPIIMMYDNIMTSLVE
jgi:hypothetical protein